jgi:hypothetical protein
LRNGLLAVVPGHSRPKDGVASLAYVPGIHVFDALSKTWMAGTSPAMTVEQLRCEANKARQAAGFRGKGCARNGLC